MDEPEGRSDTDVHGWLLLLCRLLIVGHPLSLAFTAPNAINAMSLRGAPVAIVLVVRLLVAAFGVAAGRALQHLRPGAVGLAKTALLLSAATDVVVYTTPYYPNNRVPGDTTAYVLATLAYHGLWLGYLFRSTRVRATCP